MGWKRGGEVDFEVLLDGQGEMGWMIMRHLWIEFCPLVECLGEKGTISADSFRFMHQAALLSLWDHPDKCHNIGLAATTLQ